MSPISSPDGLAVLPGRQARPRFLQGLGPGAVKSIIASATRRQCTAKSIIIAQGTPANSLFMVQTGLARHFYLTQDGRKLVLTWLRAGDISGGAALLSHPSNYLVSTETIQDSDLLVWDRDTIRELAMQHPELWENALLIAFDYLTLYVATHVALVSPTARQRLAQVLITLAKGLGEHVHRGIELEINNEELADAANLTHFTTSRLLRQWHRDGAVEKSRGKIVLRSLERLLSGEDQQRR